MTRRRADCDPLLHVNPNPPRAEGKRLVALVPPYKGLVVFEEA